MKMSTNNIMNNNNSNNKCGNGNGHHHRDKVYIYAYNIGVYDTYTSQLSKSYKVSGSAELEVDSSDTNMDAEANVKRYLLGRIYCIEPKYKCNSYAIEFDRIYFGAYIEGHYGNSSDSINI